MSNVKYEGLNLMLMKDSNINGLSRILSAIAIAMLLVGVLSIPNGPKEVVAQNATTSTNQTAGTTNQTSSLGNLTNADFGEVRENLAAARNSVFDNDSSAAYSALNTAKEWLFGIANGQEGLTERINQQFDPLRSSIDSAQESLINNDVAGALKGVNEADVLLIKVTQNLPSGEEGAAEAD